MKLYQLKLSDLDIVLEPVFKTIESAMLFRDKYITRSIEVKEVLLDKNMEDSNYIYRIETIEEDGTFLEDELFSSFEAAVTVKKNNQRVVKENIISSDTFKYVISEAI